MLRGGLVSITYKNGKSYIETSHCSPYPTYNAGYLIGESFVDLQALPIGITIISELEFVSFISSEAIKIVFVVPSQFTQPPVNFSIGIAMMDYSDNKGTNQNTSYTTLFTLNISDFDVAGRTYYASVTSPVFSIGNKIVPFINKTASIPDPLSIYLRLIAGV